MNTQKDIWSYGAVLDGEFYGPLEFLELDKAQEALWHMGVTVHIDEFDIGDETGFELQDGTRIDVEEFAKLWVEQYVCDADFAHADDLQLPE